LQENEEEENSDSEEEQVQQTDEALYQQNLRRTIENEMHPSSITFTYTTEEDVSFLESKGFNLPK